MNPATNSPSRGTVECIVTGDDAEVLHQYAADVQLTMSGTRLDDPEG